MGGWMNRYVTETEPASWRSCVMIRECLVKERERNQEHLAKLCIQDQIRTTDFVTWHSRN